MARPFYLAGTFTETKNTLPVINPYTDEVIDTVSIAEKNEVEKAITEASNSFEMTRKLEPDEKAEILDTIVNGLKKRFDELTNIIIEEVGKPHKFAKAELIRAINTFTLARNACFDFEGVFLPLGIEPRAHNKKGIIKKFPIGPIVAISPFNFPINLVAHKVGPAMAVGCPIVLKPASKTPLAALLLAEIIDQSGWPKGALSVLPCTREVGEKLATDERFKLLTFTGSPKVGWKLKEKAGKKRVVLELGGNAGVYVHEDADVERAVKSCVPAAYGSAGQSCISVQRMYVHEKVYDEFKRHFLENMQKLKCGDPKDPDTDVGPMVTPQDTKRILEWIAEAKDGGANIFGGKELDHHIVQPTLIESPKRESKVVCVEAFGPVATLHKVKSFDEGIFSINDSVYGLQAGVFTKNLNLAFEAFERLEVGGVMINEVPTFRVDHMPYGGVKDSGLGREGVKYAIEDMTEYKILVM